MGRDYAEELKLRTQYIRNLLAQSGAKGIIFGNSGGKDSALVGILCKKACENVLGVIMPCQSKRNFGEDREDGLELARQYGIESITVDLSEAKRAVLDAIAPNCAVGELAASNIAPRLRMTTLYTMGQSLGYLVAGTGNRSERYIGYFTKWGDGAHDFNPIADLTVTEIYEFLAYLNAPQAIISKAPSAGLLEGQTDEEDLGFPYRALDHYLATGEGDPETVEKIRRMHRASQHKREPISVYAHIEEQY